MSLHQKRDWVKGSLFFDLRCELSIKSSTTPASLAWTWRPISAFRLELEFKEIVSALGLCGCEFVGDAVPSSTSKYSHTQIPLQVTSLLQSD